MFKRIIAYLKACISKIQTFSNMATTVRSNFTNRLQPGGPLGTLPPKLKKNAAKKFVTNDEVTLAFNCQIWQPKSLHRCRLTHKRHLNTGSDIKEPEVTSRNMKWLIICSPSLVNFPMATKLCTNRYWHQGKTIMVPDLMSQNRKWLKKPEKTFIWLS